MRSLGGNNKLKKNLFFVIVFGITMFASLLQAQDVERSRPSDWEGLVYGGRFMDRFLPLPETGKLTSDVWGAKAVKPRYIKNGLEDDIWSYWGGNIVVDSSGKHHLFVCRWREDDPKGHMAWPKSEVVHAVSDNSIGPFKVLNVVGPGHNPEIQPLKEGGYFLYVHKFSDYFYYYADDLNGPWERREFNFDTRQRQIEDHMANNTFAKREDGSMLMVGRGGGIWLSKSGLPPFYKISAESVYPPYEGKYEDPVVWRTNIQYHLIVNDWLGRIAYYMRSKDGVNWKLDKGEAYLPGIAKHKNGKKEDWYKFERIKVLQDKYGRAYQANFAVADTIKKQDKGSDNHSSKNIGIPLTVGRLIELIGNERIDKSTCEIKLLVKAEPGFNPHRDINIKSLRFGASEEVDFGRGSKVIKKEKQGDDLILTFNGEGNGLTEENFVAKLLGKTRKDDLLFGFARLPWIEYNLPVLSAKFPELTLNSKSLKIDIEVENFGQFNSKTAELKIEYEKNGTWQVLIEESVPPLKAYEKINLTFWGQKIQERNNTVNLRIIISHKDQEPDVLEGLVTIR
ncbi:glycoside hydrolase family protein [Seonamhaeicola maritimus]|uniref:Uncharacterized protein n=1 Tax=Seonamhaeicola maritimus TaxID=2591822 RepID=A0A5C7GJ48_9FLAO|nr:glycoside hydrolase family protein [Seonamhaeicola maritimus]TXG38399.1 hypothetical protein FUA22_00520 [Seonamhaeicola maritimus]